jgi:hypothetical protein
MRLIVVRRVYFSFHHERDIWRVAEIKNHWVTKPARESAGVIDAVSWESLKDQGAGAIKKWIRNQLLGTSVTIVLIGFETHGNEYVNYEIFLSHERNNGLLGVYIHNLEDSDGKKDAKGKNPFDDFRDRFSGLLFSQIYPAYDWVEDDGYDNFENWVEMAATLVGT